MEDAAKKLDRKLFSCVKSDMWSQLLEIMEQREDEVLCGEKSEVGVKIPRGVGQGWRRSSSYNCGNTGFVGDLRPKVHSKLRYEKISSKAKIIRMAMRINQSLEDED